MLLIQEVLVSDEVIEEQFVCNLSACKGACCWEGDYGAPLETAEVHQLETEYQRISPYLSAAGREVIAREGVFTYYKEEKEFGTPLLTNGACAYMVYDESGIAKCGIEQAYRDGATKFLKPISCHLYPIRVKSPKRPGYDRMNYDRWDICSAACTLGKKAKVPVYEFVKDAIIRKYGVTFYEELSAAAQRQVEET